MYNLNMLMSRILYDRPEMQKFNGYLLIRKDKPNGFNLDILRNNKNIITVDYSENGGIIKNIDATKKEIDIVVKELNSCLSKKSCVQ